MRHDPGCLLRPVSNVAGVTLTPDAGCVFAEVSRAFSFQSHQGFYTRFPGAKVLGDSDSEARKQGSLSAKFAARTEIADGRVQIALGSVAALPSDHTFDIVTVVETHYYSPDLPANVRTHWASSSCATKLDGSKANFPSGGDDPAFTRTATTSPAAKALPRLNCLA
jgi:hypothetical protein